MRRITGESLASARPCPARQRCHQNAADEPQAVQRRPRDVCARCHPQDIDAVGRRQTDEAGTERPPERPGPPPRTAKTATTMVTRTRSPIGYAMFVATATKLPALALMIGPMTRWPRGPRHRGRRSAVHPYGLRRVRDGLAHQEANPEERTRKDGQEAEVRYRGIGTGGEVLNPSGPQHRSGCEEQRPPRGPPSPSAASSGDCPPGAQRRAPDVSRIGDPDVEEVVGRPGLAKNRRSQVEQRRARR